MATWYVDPENGTNSAASVGTGDSFATRRKTFTNLVAGVLAAGDEVRVIGSPAPTSIGPATWTDCSLVSQQTFSIVSSTNATPIVVTISSANYTTLNPAVGDTIVIYNHATNTNANGTWKISAVNGTDSVTLVNADGSASVGNGVGGATGTLKWFTNSIVTLSTACTKNIAVCGNRGTVTNWTASANVTSGVYTTEAKEGGECISLAVAAGFTTGMAAYYATGTLDLSGYQQVSFWVKQTVGTVGAAGAARLRLCTDTAGATPVHDIPIPYLANTNWSPVVVDLGTNLNSAIKSINLDIVTDNGAQTFLIDNVIACKAASSGDSLNLTSLISKDPGDRSYGDTYESYWAVQSINGTRVVLDQVQTSVPLNAPNTMRGYSGDTETVTTYKRETLKPAAVASTTINASTVAGTSGSHITYSGGWDRTAMTTQNLETWVSGSNGSGIFFSVSHAFLEIDKINVCRIGTGIELSTAATDFTVGTFYACSMPSAGFSGPGTVRTTADLISVVTSGSTDISLGYQTTADVLVSHSNSGVGVSVTAQSIIGTIKSRNNSSYGLRPGSRSVVDYVKAEYNASGGLALSNECVIKEAILNYNGYGIGSPADGKILSGSSSNSTTAFMFTSQSNIFIKDFVVGEATEIGGLTSEGVYSFNYLTYFENYDGVAGDMHAVCSYGEINSDTGVTHGDSTFSWRFSPTTTYASDRASLLMPIWKKACAASVPVTFNAWFRRDNTGLTGKLLVRGIYPGVTTDVSDSISVGADTWEQLSVTVTPDEDCVIEVFASFYGGVAYNGYVADLSEA